MLAYVVRRVAVALVVMAVALTLVFLVIRVVPGDPALLVLGTRARPEVVQAVRESLGLDRPLHVQYYNWWRDLIHLDLGQSFYTKLPVIHEVLRRFPRSMELIVLSLALAVLLGIPIGILASSGRKSLSSLSSSTALMLISVPDFVIGTALVLLFSLQLRLLPSGGFVGIMRPMEHLRRVILPVMMMAVGPTGIVIRMVRGNLSATLRTDYVTTARAKGLSEAAILFKHALRNIMVPIVAILGVEAGVRLGGMVIAEAIFSWPGISSLLIDACYQRDYPVIQGVILLTAVYVISVNLLVDLVNAVVNPKIRYE